MTTKLNTGASSANLPIFRLYIRGLGMLSQECWLATGLAAAGLVLAAIQLAEPVLFGRVIDALNSKSNPAPLIALWAGLGLFGIIAGVIVAIYADRLAHRRKHAEMVNIFERAIALPQHFHAQRGSGAIIRAILLEWIGSRIKTT